MALSKGVDSISNQKKHSLLKFNRNKICQDTSSMCAITITENLSRNVK